MWPISEKPTFLWTFQLELCVVNGNILFVWIYWNTNSSIWKHVRLLHLDFHCFVDRSIFDIELSVTHTPISVGDLNNVKQLIDFISTCPSIFVKFEKCRTNAHTKSICPEKKTKSLVYNMQRKWLKSVYSWIFAQRTNQNKTFVIFYFDKVRQVENELSLNEYLNSIAFQLTSVLFYLLLLKMIRNHRNGQHFRHWLYEYIQNTMPNRCHTKRPKVTDQNQNLR